MTAHQLNFILMHQIAMLLSNWTILLGEKKKYFINDNKTGEKKIPQIYTIR